MNAVSKDQQPLLQVTDLVVDFAGPHGRVPAVKGVSFTIAPRETLAVVGESGSGKSTLAMAVIRLLATNGEISSGSVVFDGKELTSLPLKEMQKIRGAQIGLVPQDPMSNLNPLKKIGAQIAETLLVHGFATKADVHGKVILALEAAGVNNAAQRAGQYPHELSGGLRQRALIAIGLACRPKLLIADEPTSALDVTLQRTILDQIDRMAEEIGTSVLMITHDLALAAERAQKIVVMSKGKIVEAGPTKQILTNPQHEYTKALLAAAPAIAAVRLQAQAQAAGAGTAGQDRAVVDNILEVEHVSKVYKLRGKKEVIHANADVSFTIPRGKTVAIVGESGSGKTTVSRILLRLTDPTSGRIIFDGHQIPLKDKAELADFRQRVQPIFQDPYSSLNPMYTVGGIIEEPLAFYKRGDKKQRHARVLELLDQVALPADLIDRHPAELSGGQRQRVAIARAIALNPEFLVCDEPVSALDVLVQAQILKLLERLQKDLGLSYLFISHDLAVVRLISDYVCVMKDGEIVEAAASEEIFQNPQHEYTKKLLASIPGNKLAVPNLA